VVPGCVARPLDLIPGLLPGVGSRRAPSPPGMAARPPAAAKRWSCSAITAAHTRAPQVGSCHRWPATSRASSGTDIPAVGSMSRAFLRPRRSLRPGAVSALRACVTASTLSSVMPAPRPAPAHRPFLPRPPLERLPIDHRYLPRRCNSGPLTGHTEIGGVATGTNCSSTPQHYSNQPVAHHPDGQCSR
jgi:hypothetical protein